MKMLERAREVLRIEIEELQRACSGLDAGFSQAAALFLERMQKGGKIVVAGVGKSYLVGRKIAATLASTGSPSVAVHPAQAMHGDIGILHANDVLLALSFTGESGELLEMLPVVRRQGSAIVAMTNSTGNALAQLSDAVIKVAVLREACPFNMAPTASTTAMMALGDALAIVLLEARGFQRDDFAKLHPGGAIGRALLMRISDIMRTGERLAAVPCSAVVQDALVAMTRARSGSAAVLDEQRRVAGIFTDGDLRRLIGHQDDLIRQPMDAVMTRNPVMIRADELAVTALRIFEQNVVDDLLVVDHERRLVGMVDIQDLPKFKIL